MDKNLANELLKQWEEMGDSHISIKQETPLREDAFAMDDALKIELIAKHFKEIMHVLGLDLTDESLQGTPLRVAKMYVNEHFKGLNYFGALEGSNVKSKNLIYTGALNQKRSQLNVVSWKETGAILK